MTYQIANIRINVRDISLWDAWGKFEENNSLHELCDALFVGKAAQCDENYGFIELKPENDNASPVKYWKSGEEVFYTDLNMLSVNILVEESVYRTSLVLNFLFYSRAVYHKMLQLHCATIDDDGRGILFLGPSGIGKTTQAERWAQYRGSAIINGDIGFVQRTPAGYTAWGTPWHGSSPYCLNASVPVKALVVLKQAPQNALRELTGFEKVREVSGSVFYPTWLEDGMELCTDTLNHLLSDLPVYRLDNRADEDAVRLLAAEIDRIS